MWTEYQLLRCLVAVLGILPNKLPASAETFSLWIGVYAVLKTFLTEESDPSEPCHPTLNHPLGYSRETEWKPLFQV